MTSFPPFRLDVINQCLWRGETRVSLMPKPFAVLRYLVEHSGSLVTQDELLAAVWPDTFVQPEVLRRYILEIRRALGDQARTPRFIQTFPRRGYQFIARVVNDSATATAEGVLAAMPLVGRESALADLSRCLTSARNGRVQLVFVVGEPGIGKTRLLDEFQHASASISGVTVARGQSVEGFGGKEAYYPLLEAVGQLARGPARTFVVQTLAAHAPTWLVQMPSLVLPDHQAALQRQVLGATRERMVSEFCEALEVITHRTSLVLILEDLHWVDHPTLNVLGTLARRRQPAKLLVVGTLRPADLIVSESPLKTLRQELVANHLSHEIELERLAPSDVADYVAATYAPGDLAADLAGIIYRHSNGNPLFMIALLDHLAATGVLTQTDGRWKMARPLDDAEPGVPETLRRMLEMQLQHSTDAEQQMLRIASVAGEHFTVWAVTTMAPEERADVEEICETLAARQQFLRSSGTRRLSNGLTAAEYRFTHALYREVLYRGLSPTQRIALHGRLGRGLEQLRSPIEPEMAGEIALHFEHGHEYDKAVRYHMVAAQTATRRYAHQQAIAILEHARDLLSRTLPEQAAALELEILERIGNAYYALGDMERSTQTYESMAMRAADAGLLASHADTLMRLAHPAESVPYFLKAIELDPNFVSAYTSLSRIFSNLGVTERAQAFARLAYDRRDSVSDRDRLSITYQFHYEVTGDQARASETLEQWKRAFPREFQPVNSLTVMHNFLGDFARAIEEGKDAVKRNPLHGYPYSNLAHAYRGIGQFDAARTTAEEAVARQIETLPTRRLLYQLALAAGDHQEARKHLDWAKDRPREFDMIGAHAQATAWSGRVREARQLYEDAARLAELRNLDDVGSSHLAWAVTMELAFGYQDTALQLAHRVLARRPSYDPRLRAAMVLAACGQQREAEAIALDLAAANPEHTFINSVLVPIVRAAVALGCREPARASEQLRIVAPYELGFIAALAPLYLRAQAHVMQGRGAEAAAEFQRILGHRGSDPFSPLHAIAPLCLARAHAMTGNVTASLQAYEAFLTQWRNADHDVPVLLEARRECDRLKGDAPPLNSPD